MTPQSTFMVLAPIDPHREAELRRLLESMNGVPDTPGPTTRSSAGQFARARRALSHRGRSHAGDNRVYGIQAPVYPRGGVSRRGLVAEISSPMAPARLKCARSSRVVRASPPRRFLEWRVRTGAGAGAAAVNCRGRTVRQVREGELRDAVGGESIA
jgi:hypothetical protein